MSATKNGIAIKYKRSESQLREKALNASWWKINTQADVYSRAFEIARKSGNSVPAPGEKSCTAEWALHTRDQRPASHLSHDGLSSRLLSSCSGFKTVLSDSFLSSLYSVITIIYQDVSQYYVCFLLRYQFLYKKDKKLNRVKINYFVLFIANGSHFSHTQIVFLYLFSNYSNSFSDKSQLLKVIEWYNRF